MNILILFIVVMWGLRIVLNVLTYAHLWWVKEYRFDRMIIHLKTPQGKRIWSPEWKRPPWSPKSVLLSLLTLGCIGFLLRTTAQPLLLRFAVADIVSFPITGIFVAVLILPTAVVHRLLISVAVQRLRRHKPMTVIGITGSFGKTSVKEYLSAILSAKYSVIKTEASKNSPIGIAEVILKNLNSDHDVFVVEMGAYKRGEIARMVRMVQPQIGIITAINAQHQDLFGSIENTVQAKYELIRGLTGKKTAIFNADNAHTMRMADQAMKENKHVWAYTCARKANRRIRGREHVLKMSNIASNLQGVSGIVEYGSLKKKLTAPVVGEHQASNILAAISGALAAGMNFTDAVSAVSGIRAVPKVLEVAEGINGSVFINDTFNNNPDAAKAALSVLKQSKGKKYLVFQPMIELGSYADRSHEEVGAYAGSICDKIFLTNQNYYEAFQKGVRRKSALLTSKDLSPEEIAGYLQTLLKKGDSVLFKGKEAEAVFQKLVH